MDSCPRVGENHFLQSHQWGELRSKQGWKALSFRSFLLLEKPITPFFSLIYLPYAEIHKDHLAQEVENLRNFVRESVQKALLIRWDVPWQYNTLEDCQKAEDFLRKKGLHKARNIQVPTTLVSSLQLSEEELLNQMKSKTRYNVRLSSRKGIHIKQSDSLDSWYALHQETARRQNISTRGLTYFQDLQRIFSTRLHCYLAYREDALLAGILVLHWNEQAIYLYGASSVEGHPLMASYALHWYAIKEARRKGCRHYDWWGIARDIGREKKLAGLNRFKMGFGGRVLYRPGCWDINLKGLLSYFARTAENIFVSRSY